ncbi:TrkH family potassium uptake protein [Actinomycetaceae bacterium Sa1BUA1]|uniref:TrkH family potassium uptake protein n=1 Tax=Oceanitalea stevensii TaxID=2763072 RepID=A0ABR8Z067_9MICO|nr:TrkH family potassium uptake protein [Oceanitalea stevensii]
MRVTAVRTARAPWPRRALGALRDAVDNVARHSPARLALLVFAAIIAVVTALLSLPAATRAEEPATFVDALFTAVSAVCVTGLTTVSTATYWSGFGQAVIIVAVKIGGLGVMTLASILGLAVSRRIGLTQRLLAASETKTTRLGEVGTLVRAVVVASLAVELAVFLVLLPRFLSLGESLGPAAWHALFMAVSIFNNAGFVVLEGGMAPFVGDWWMCLPIIVGGAIGALGFPVILNVASRLRGDRRLSLHTKLTVVTYSLLAVGGSLAFAVFEWRNSATLGELPVADRVLASLLAGVNSRSSGLSTVDLGVASDATWFVTDALMFVGGGSASTAGGIKVTTFAVLVLAIVAEARGDRDAEAFGRRIGTTTIRLAVAVAFLGATLVGVGTLLLLALTDYHLELVLFEVISAFATVGLSTGITPDLPDAAKYVLSALMFAGRLGTVTLAGALALRQRRRVIRMPSEPPIVG